MKRFTGVILLCVSLVALCGCTLVSSKSKDTGKKKEREVKVLGIPLMHTEEKVNK
jgi:hypothetical protein